MGCNASVTTFKLSPSRKPNSTNGEAYKTRNDMEQPQLLSAKQKKIVKKTWRILSNDMQERGIRVFYHIFSNNPELKKLFPFKDVHESDLTKDVRFCGHALRFMQAIGGAVDNMDDLEKDLSPVLLNLGQIHARRPGFNQNNFLIFKDSVMYIWAEDLGPKFDQDAKEAWTIAFEFITNKLMEGYLRAQSR